MGSSSIDHSKWAEFKDQPTSTKATTTNQTAASTAKASTKPTSTASQIIYPNDPIPTQPATYQTEKAKIEIQNGTAIEGWAGVEATKLKARGFIVVKTGNAAAKTYKSIKIYDFSGGAYSLTTSELQAIYGVKAVAPPSGLTSSGNILIILGK